MIPRQRGDGQPAPGGVLAVVGTDVHGFDRLIEWLERWDARRRDGEAAAGPTLVIQYGHSRPPALPGSVAFLGHEDLQRAMAHAALVVSHGGPATITEARRNGHLPIVVPRDPAYREHVDNHQQLFARRLGAAGMVRLCEREADLVDALDRGLSDPSAFALAGGGRPGDASATAVAKVGRIVDDLVERRSRRAPRWRGMAR